MCCHFFSCPWPGVLKSQQRSAGCTPEWSPHLRSGPVLDGHNFPTYIFTLVIMVQKLFRIPESVCSGPLATCVSLWPGIVSHKIVYRPHVVVGLTSLMGDGCHRFDKSWIIYTFPSCIIHGYRAMPFKGSGMTKVVCCRG